MYGTKIAGHLSSSIYKSLDGLRVTSYSQWDQERSKACSTIRPHCNSRWTGSYRSRKMLTAKTRTFTVRYFDISHNRLNCLRGRELLSVLIVVKADGDGVPPIPAAQADDSYHAL